MITVTVFYRMENYLVKEGFLHRSRDHEKYGVNGVEVET
jgi:hypothetical protein